MNIGIDTVEILRIAELSQKEAFMLRVYSEAERDEFLKRGNKANHMASAFVAKEAFSKAIGTGISGFSLPEVSLLHKQNGEPYLLLSGEAKRIAGARALCFDVSVTHTNSLATAIVLAYDDLRLSND